MPFWIGLRGLNRLDEADVAGEEGDGGRGGVGVDEEAENSVDVLAGDEAMQAGHDAGVARTFGVQCTDLDSGGFDLIRHRAARGEGGHLHLSAGGFGQRGEANGQFTDHRRRSADVQVGHQKEDAPHRQGIG